MPGKAGWICCEPDTSGRQVCGHGGLAVGQPGATGVGGKAWGAAAADAPAGWEGVGCIHTHAALVGPASSLAGRLRRGDAIPAPASVAAQRRRPQPLLARPVAEKKKVDTAAIPVGAAEQLRGAAFTTATT